MKKNLAALMALLISVQILQAQPSKAPLTQTFSRNIETVVRDFRNNFFHIQKELISKEAGFDTYGTTVQIAGAKDCFIRRYHSKKDTSASWQAVMYEGEDAEQAAKVYKSTCKSIQRSRVNLHGYGNLGFSGTINEISEDISFAESLFQLKTEEEEFELFYAEVEMVNPAPFRYVVNMSVFKKKKDEDK